MTPAVVASNKNNNTMNEEEQDALELEAALSAACHVADDSSPSNDNDVDSLLREEEHEVSYSENSGTPLFKALEHCEWQQAFELCTPALLKTWVKSTGTTDTTFGWAIWRRLPLHEACRRQAPAWLLVKMLSEYPESASRETQFGELALHVAVETGSTPEVIHLLLVENVSSVLHKDNSGRTPLDIIQENEYPDPVVLESLQRATANHVELVTSCQDKIKNIHAKHQQDTQQLLQKHSQDIQKEKSIQAKLEKALQDAHEYSQHMKQFGQDSQSLAELKGKETKDWQTRVEQLTNQVSTLQNEQKLQQYELESLQSTVEERDSTIQQRDERIALLEQDLQNCLVFSRDKLTKSVERANADLQLMVSSQQALQGMLVGQERGLEQLLELRSIQIPEVPVAPSPPPPPPQVDTTQAVHAASKAASKALEVSNAKQGYV